MATILDGRRHLHSSILVADPARLRSDQFVTAALGTTSNNGVTYTTTAQNITGLMPAGSAGVNHSMICLPFSLDHAHHVPRHLGRRYCNLADCHSVMRSIPQFQLQELHAVVLRTYDVRTFIMMKGIVRGSTVKKSRMGWSEYVS